MVELEKKIQQNYAVQISRSHLDWIGCSIDDIVIVKDDEGKYGRFLSMWKKESE